MNIVRNIMAVSGVVAAVALGSLAALPASAQSWHHHHRWHPRHQYAAVGHPIFFHHYGHPTVIVRRTGFRHHPFHTTVTKTVVHGLGRHTTVTKTVIHHP